MHRATQTPSIKCVDTVDNCSSAAAAAGTAADKVKMFHDVLLTVWRRYRFNLNSLHFSAVVYVVLHRIRFSRK